MSDYKVIFITMTNYNQLSIDGKEISWIDNTPTRFQMYSTLTDDDYAIIRGSGNQKSVYIGKIKNKTINSNQVNLVISIKEEFYINGDKLLCVNEISPEFQSQMKAHFKPYISERPIDIDKVINELKNENYIDFYIINTNHSNFQGLLKQIKQNDRVVFYGKEFQNFYIANDFKREGAYPADAFSSKGKTLDDLIQNFNQISKADKQKSKNVVVIEKIKDSIIKDGIYKFNSFAYYWNIIHNKRAGYQLLTDDGEDKMKNYIVEDIPLNTILYGPPGTGKTYQTIEKAIRIVNPGFTFPNSPYSKEDRKIIKNEYDRLYNEGKIVFTSFHQSLSYEDFIEGIKPVLSEQDMSNQDDNGNQDKIRYSVEPGIFRHICESADQKKKNISKYDFDESKIEFNKMSLGNTQKDDENIFEYCINNNVIALGYGRDIDYSNEKTKDEIMKVQLQKYPDINKFSWEAVDRFKHIMKKDDVIMISKGNKYIRAIGRIKGEYYYDANAPIRYNHFRKVEWLYTDTSIPVEQILNDKILSQQTIYQFYKKDLNINYIKSLLSFANDEIENEKYVLIIDEINRGNVSQIFGELITLIEDDKRAGKPEALKVMLPYSKKLFSVPLNLYIIGTMNTADRSVEALDTALRRRFSFEFMPPRYDLPELDREIAGIKLSSLLKTINERITYLLDEDHQIGHSYFMSIEDEDGLRHVFRNKIIPLLKEYFYNDFGKIRLILGDQIVKLMPDNAKPGFAVSDVDLLEKEQYRIMLDDDSFDIITALKKMIENIS